MNPAALVLIFAAALLTPCAAAASGPVRTDPGPADSRAAAERVRTEAAVRQLRSDVERTLGTCRRARDLRQRCSCYRALRHARGEVVREKQRVSNIQEVRLRVMKDGIRQTNEDRKYWLSHLRELNAMGDALSEYLHELTGSRRAPGKVGNPRATGGGSDAEPVSEARCRNVRSLRSPPAGLRPRSGVPLRPGGAGQDIMALVQAVLKESYTESSADLRLQAQKVKHHRDRKKKLRDALKRARGHVRASGHPCGPGAPPEIRELCGGIARLERRLREIEAEERRR